jgi:hypothetical protein
MLKNILFKKVVIEKYFFQFCAGNLTRTFQEYREADRLARSQSFRATVRFRFQRVRAVALFNNKYRAKVLIFFIKTKQRKPTHSEHSVPVGGEQ